MSCVCQQSQPAEYYHRLVVTSAAIPTLVPLSVLTPQQSYFAADASQLAFGLATAHLVYAKVHMRVCTVYHIIRVVLACMKERFSLVTDVK